MNNENIKSIDTDKIIFIEENIKSYDGNIINNIYKCNKNI